MKAKLRKLISKHNLERIADPLLALAKVGIRIVKQRSGGRSEGASRFGGLPDVPKGFSWPVHDGRPLGFLAQIHCAEVAPHDRERALPDSGVLHFFYDLQEQPWGHYSKDKGGAVVLYTPDVPLHRAPSKRGRDSAGALPAVPIGFESFLSIPSQFSADFYSFNLEDFEEDDYSGLYDALARQPRCSEPYHQLLGYADHIQGDMGTECQLATSGLSDSSAGAPNVDSVRCVKAEAAQWRLLLQFDSDEILKVEWGESGMLYFWIRELDLRQRNFNQAWAILQCT